MPFQVNRNKDNDHYFSLIAQNKAVNRKKSHIIFHKFKYKDLVKYIQQKLLLGWSPEQIYGRIKNFHKQWAISFKTIYNWIYSGLFDKVTSKNLRRKGKKRRSQENRGKFNGKSIKERDNNVNDRITLGHWEGDTIVSSRGKSKSCLITLVERVSRFTLAMLVKNKTTKVINKNIIHYLSILPKNIVKTITFDRGKEFANWQPDFSPHVLVEGIMKLNEFNNAFQTEQQCLAYIANLKENKCIRCFSFNLNTSDLKRMRCLKCNQTFSILTGTIFSRSQTSLTSWFYLIFRWINTKHGIPSTDIAKELGVTLKTAWRMTHKIRTRIAKQKPQFIVEGTVQIDEMYLSHMGFKKQGRSLVNKTLIVGIYQKTTNNLIVKVLKNAKSKNLLQFAKNHISSKCLVYTDSWKGYCDFKSVFTKHETVNHQDGYVSKIGVNTNQIESVWKHIRRTFKTHIKVAKHHVHLYAKEAAYKFNKIPSFETVMLCLI
ncbi:IS30 family transposase [Spiroplasma ixodetis]|uniref:ISXO2-like transposase domain-containing protein n=7 Tax=Spiroplasma TaxID=2132 RepID=A0ABM8BTE5_9MOLU|nr:IS30 family transposase [Spiroplasma ixodetis]BDT03123.1 hypothetical protein SHM_07690 [Spiroplasma ixodetis]